MAKLKPNSVVKTTEGEDVTIQSELGEGGQGVVYKVLYKEKPYALKWYSKGVGQNVKKFYRNLKNNIRTGSPAPTFLWPLALTEQDESGCFGYVMDLRPAEYKDFDLFLLNRAQFKTFSAIVNAALQIAASFRLLHNKGLSYQDLNDGNFFINPETGDVLICDNDNVAPDGDNLGIQGKPKYMAPEVVLLNKKPDTFSDRFSLAVVLFILLFRDHPLMGMRDNNKTDPSKNEMNLYCENPVFVYDPQDDSNRPNPEINRNVLLFWPVYPPSIKLMFIKAFAKPLMKNTDCPERQDRVTEKEWIKELTKLRTQIITSPVCGEETFFDVEDEEHICVNTDKKFEAPPLLKVRGLAIPLQPGRKIHHYEIDSSVDIYLEELGNVIGEVIANKNKPNIWGLKNLSHKTWIKTTPAGNTEPVESGKVIPVARGIKIQFPSKVEGIIE